VAKKDSIIGHCLMRAIIVEQGGIEAAVEKYGPKAERLSKWSAIKTAAKVMPKATRVAGFIVFWAVAMREEGKDEFSITEYQRFWSEGERQTYRLQKEFRELWWDFETPNELARQLVKHLDRNHGSKRDVAALPLQLQLVA
jgi:hypothetical protein